MIPPSKCLSFLTLLEISFLKGPFNLGAKKWSLVPNTLNMIGGKPVEYCGSPRLHLWKVLSNVVHRMNFAKVHLMTCITDPL
jgi:hypothetical protein